MSNDKADETGHLKQYCIDSINSFDKDFKIVDNQNSFNIKSSAKQRNHDLQKTNLKYFKELFKLQKELIKLQEWVVATGQKIIILFEGRDTSGKSSIIKRIVQRTNPKVFFMKSFAPPSQSENMQWYFQRYVAQFPSAGEVALFDRSWYSRAMVEKVMGFCTHDQYEEFLITVPEFEKLILRSGIKILKYWLSITYEEQYLRLLDRIHNPMQRWKLSSMDLKSRALWDDYTRAKEIMMARTHNTESPWWIVPAIDKKRARLNCISHLLSQFQYHDIDLPTIVLKEDQRTHSYLGLPASNNMIIPQIF